MRARFGVELKAYRKGKAKSRSLIAHIDADTGTVQNRVDQLTEGQNSRKPGESIIFLIPKRNIETWIYHLLGNEADEIDDYSRTYKNKSNQSYCQPAAVALVALVRDPNIQPSLPSLQLAVHELREKLAGTT